MHLVRLQRLGVPQETRDALTLLEGAGVVDHDLSDCLKKEMVEVRNVAIHGRDPVTPGGLPPVNPA